MIVKIFVLQTRAQIMFEEELSQIFQLYSSCKLEFAVYLIPAMLTLQKLSLKTFPSNIASSSEELE